MSETVNEQNRTSVPTRTQVSSGGIVYRCSSAGGLEVVLIATQLGERWGLPKGQVEAGETLEETAVREVREETGLDAEIVDELSAIEYWYWWTEGTQKVRYHKRVHFFLMECRGGDLARHDFEAADVRWYAIDAAIAASSYDSERRLIEVAKERLSGKC